MGDASFEGPSRASPAPPSVLAEDDPGFAAELDLSESGRDGLLWVAEFERELMRWPLTMWPDALAELDLQQVAAAAAPPDFTSGAVAFLAAEHFAKTNRATLVRDLMDLAFLSYVDTRNALKRHGLDVDPMRHVPQSERKARALRALVEMRTHHSDEDWDACLAR